jgi:uncharacterized membrane protein YgcG
LDDTKNLREYQNYLLEKLFDEEANINDKKQKYVLLSDLKNKFYKHLNGFKEKLYTEVSDMKYFDGNPDKVRQKWIAIYIFIEVAAFIVLSTFTGSTQNFFPYISLVFSSIIALPLALKMPRRTAMGYSLYRQIEGLKFYLGKGKWRHEVAEKHLFFEEVLPLAISLGVVSRLTRDMQNLTVKPPDYIAGATTASLGSDIRGFATTSANTFMSAPGGKWSGSSSWSGGSGFSGGGSSGGGFGGGGGGSW